jgi:dihydroxyacetone kinase-like predicted kinase
MNRVHIELNDDWEGSEYRYCTEFLFKAANKDFDEPATLDFLATMGDCELLVGAWPEFKIHVHTNTPDAVLGHMLQEGQIFEVFIHNMDLEAHERTAAIAADKRGEAAGAQGAGAPSAPRKELGFVAVAAGEGQAEILTSLGVDYVVSGGQTMNPSTADILAAVEKVAAKHVVVLPNNSNIRMAAEAAAAACTSCEVAVVPTKTVLQAFAAMFVVDLDLPLEDNIAAMVEAIAEVRGGEVTMAVRDSQAATGEAIHAGDVIGIEDDAIYVVGKAIDEVALALINRMQEAQEGDTLTLLAGSDMSDEELAALVEKIEGAQPDLEVDAQRGDQPLYPLIFSIE